METTRTRLLRLSLIALVAAGAGRTSGADRTSLPYPIWPIPQEARYADDRLLLRDAVIVVPKGEARAQYPGRLLAALLADQFGVALPVLDETPAGSTPIAVGETSNPALAAAVSRLPGPPAATVPDPADGYLLHVGSSGAVVAGRDYRGTLYGVSSFVQLVHRWGKQSVAVRQATVRDWPFLAIRWVHVYLPGREQLAFAERYLRDFLLRYKFNGLVLELGGGMRLESHPEISVGWRRTVAEWYAHGETMDTIGEGIPLGTANRFAASLHVGVGGGAYVEKDDVHRLAALAERYGLEIVPEIQSLSHTYYIASARRDVAEDPDMEWPDSYCPSNPESYRILFDVMDEYLEVLKPRRVHIGHDETAEKDWPGRVKRHGTLGGEVSSWGALEEFLLGKLQIPEAAFSANLLWSTHQPAREMALEQVGLLMPEVRRVLSARPAPSLVADPMRFEVLDLQSAFNHPAKGAGWDLTGLAAGRAYSHGFPYAIADPRGARATVVVARRPGGDPTRVALPVSGRWASLLFLQAATGEGRPTIHAGDQTHFPRESSELLGYYEIRFADDLLATHEIRFDETVGRWDAGLGRTYYLTRPVVAGRLPDQRDVVLWASEWTNPRPDVPIASVALVGSPGPSDARPILFGVTGVQKPRVEDYR